MARAVGTPTWLDYSSNDFATSMRFYANVFGWQIEDQGDAYGHYHLVTVDGHEQAGMMNTAGMSCPDGDVIPASWDVHLAVDSVDERLPRAEAAGARIVIPAQDIPGRGRFAGVIDPQGAYVALWEDKGFEGYTFTAGPGTPVWFELMSMDLAGSKRFYREVFDFDPVDMAVEPGDPAEDGPGYATNGPMDSASSGMCDATEWYPHGTRSFWRVYFCIADTEQTLARVRENGGSVLDGPVDSPFGRVTTVQDPVGATFQVNQPLG